MNKSELVSALAEKTDMTKKDSAEMLDGLLAVVVETLQKGEDIAIAGFGTLKVKERAARTGRNPQTGETIQIAASKAISFKAGKTLKDAVKD